MAPAHPIVMKNAMKNLFSDTYFEAHTRFLDASNAQSYRSSHCAPEGQPLSTDVAYLGDPDASSLFASITGTHGVEARRAKSGPATVLLRRSKP